MIAFAHFFLTCLWVGMGLAIVLFPFALAYNSIREEIRRPRAPAEPRPLLTPLYEQKYHCD